VRYNHETILSTKAVIAPASNGYLAVSERGSALRIGVRGSSEPDARRRFRAELEAWAALHEREPDQARPAL